MTLGATLPPMPPAARRRATYQDVLDAPPHKVAQIIDGELIVMPRPAAPHASASSKLGWALGPAFDRKGGSPAGPGGWILLFEPAIHLGDDILVPDFAGWRRERMPALPDAAYFTLAPDWVCEVLSPSTAKLDRARKLPIYAREEIAHVWFVDPAARTLEVMRGEGPAMAPRRRLVRRRTPPRRAVRRDRARARRALGRPRATRGRSGGLGDLRELDGAPPHFG
jgi:Uma2 family endonuclease